MKHRFVQKNAFKIVGLMKRVPIVFHGINPAIAELSQNLTPEMIERLKTLSDMEPSGIISASANFSLGRMEEKGELDHYIGVATTSDQVDDFSVLEVDAGQWVVFEIVGPFPQTLQKAWGEIYSNWLPSTDFEPSGGPEILWNKSADTSDPEYHSEIWIPVKIKDEAFKWFA